MFEFIILPYDIIKFIVRLSFFTTQVFYEDIVWFRKHKHDKFVITPWNLNNLKEGSVLSHTFAIQPTVTITYRVKEIVLIDKNCYVFKLHHEIAKYDMIMTFEHRKIYKMWKIVKY